MKVQAIVESIDKQIAILQQARNLLTSAGASNGPAAIKRGPGRPKELVAVTTKKRVMSPEAKARICRVSLAVLFPFELLVFYFVPVVRSSFLLKRDFAHIVWTPLFPSTSSVMSTSHATEISA
jgi:hypothetical protein